MAERVPQRAIELTDPRALRALAHPVRLALIGLLRREGPLTATAAGARLGESATTCSFHLRQLAKYGLVEEAGRGPGRERPWRATALFTSWPNVAPSAEMAAASQLLEGIIVERYLERLTRWLEQKPSEPREWQEASGFGDWILYVTADELAELGRAVEALVERYAERTADPARRPADARLVGFIALAFPEPGPPEER